jgi:autotransporter-associated beta strand protein
MADRHRTEFEGTENVGVRRRFFSICAKLGVAAAAALFAGPVDAATKVVYDSTNFYTSGADGYGFLGIPSLDRSAIFGDSLRLTATGKLTSFTWVAFNGPNASYDLTSASQTISFYRQSDNSLIGSFNATITDLGTGTSKTYTADLGSSNIVLDTPDVLVTQQIPSLSWPPGAPSYKLGTVIATASNTPAIGSTSPGYYLKSLFNQPGGFVTNGDYSSAVYRAVVIPDVTWNTTDGTWNTSTSNWTTGSGPNDTFSDGSQATFNNASGGIVTLSGPLAPRAVVVSATGGNYAFVSTAGNEITGAATLSKSGAGTLLLYGPNSYSGGTTLNGGALTLGHADAIGASGTISFGGGTLRYSENNTTDYSARFSNAASQQYKIDTYGETVTLASNLTSSGGSFTKLGSGTVTLTGANTYSGATTVSAGTLLVNGSLANSAVTVGNGGTLGGGGAIGGAVSVATGGALGPGNSIESLSTGTATFAAGASFAYELDSSDPLSLGSAADLLVVSGNLNLDTGNGTILTVADLAGSPNAFVDNTTIFALINYSGTWNGGLFTYGGAPLADGGTFTVGGQQFLIDYDRTSSAGLANFTGDYLPGSSFVTITAVPEPATYAMALAGLACGGYSMFRRRKGAEDHDPTRLHRAGSRTPS